MKTDAKHQQQKHQSSGTGTQAVQNKYMECIKK